MTQSASRMHFTVKSESTSQRMFLLTKPFMGRRLAKHRNMAKLSPCSSAPPRVPRKKSSSFFIRPCGVTPIPRGVRVLPWTIARTSGARWNLYRESGCHFRPGPPPLDRDDDIVVAFFAPFRDFRGRHELVTSCFRYSGFRPTTSSFSSFAKKEHRLVMILIDFVSRAPLSTFCPGADAQMRPSSLMAC